MLSWRRFYLALCVTSVLLAASSASRALAAGDARTEVRRTADGLEIRAQARVGAPAAVVWQVLTDYEHLPQFIPGITRSVVKERRGERLIVEQTGEARFLLFTFPVEVTYEVTESPQASMSSRAIAGNLKRMAGRYDIEADGRGARLRYAGFVDPDFDVPDFLETAALRSMVDEQFSALVVEIERRAAAQAGK